MSDDMVRLYIQLMGSAAIAGGGMPLALNQLKSRALLYYFAATGRSHTRDHLATMLWSESGQREAYHSLRSSLYYLRKVLQVFDAADVFVSEEDLLGLDLTSCGCDGMEMENREAWAAVGYLHQMIQIDPLSEGAAR